MIQARQNKVRLVRLRNKLYIHTRKVALLSKSARELPTVHQKPGLDGRVFALITGLITAESPWTWPDCVRIASWAVGAVVGHPKDKGLRVPFLWQ